MSTRAEEIAAKEYPDLFIRDDKMKTSGTALISDAAQMLRREGFINGYKQGQQDRWIPVSDGARPKIGDEILILRQRIADTPIAYIIRYLTTEDIDERTTHWMPRPPNPEQR